MRTEWRFWNRFSLLTHCKPSGILPPALGASAVISVKNRQNIRSIKGVPKFLSALVPELGAKAGSGGLLQKSCQENQLSAENKWLEREARMSQSIRNGAKAQL